MIKLYGIPPSFPVNRVRLCLNAMNKDYEFIIVSPLAGETQTEDYLKMSPAGKVPAIDIDGFTLFESNSIMKYLCRKFDSDLYPNDIEAQAHVDKWLDFTGMHVANGIGKVLFNKLIAPMLEMDVDEQSLKDGYDFIGRFFAVLDQHFQNNDYLANGILSIADLGLLATIDPTELIEIDMSEYPYLNKWQQKLKREEFYQKMHGSYAEAIEAMQS